MLNAIVTDNSTETEKQSNKITTMEQNKEEDKLNVKGAKPFAQTYFHGTRLT